MIQRVKESPFLLNSGWQSNEWRNINMLAIPNYRLEGTNHKPITHVKLQYENDRLYGLFKVRDKYIRCVNTEFQSPVLKDSCVEFFVKPQKSHKEYINFEFNCDGALLCNYVEEPERLKGGPLKKKTPLTKGEVKGIKIYHSMRQIVEHEIKESKSRS